MSSQASMMQQVNRYKAGGSRSVVSPNQTCSAVANSASLGMSPEVERPPLFFGVSPAEFQGISAASRSKEYARDEVLFFEGDIVGQVILLTTDLVKITQLGTNGSQVVLKFGVPGEALGAAALFSAATHRSTAQAFRACRVSVWEASTFKGLVDRLPALHQNMARLLGEDLLELEEHFREVATVRFG